MAVRPGWLLPTLALGGLGAGNKGRTLRSGIRTRRFALKHVE